MCSVEGCGVEKVVAHGLCRKHYSREYVKRPGNAEKANEAARKYREANPGAQEAATKKWREANPERVKESHSARQRRRYAESPDMRETTATRTAEWREANPDKVRELARKQTAKRRNLQAGIDPSGMQAAVDSGMRDLPCACCARPGPSEIDHIIPLSWAEGRPWIAALLAEPTSYQPLCESCNARKGNRVAVAYVDGTALYLFSGPDPRSQGRLGS